MQGHKKKLIQNEKDKNNRRHKLHPVIVIILLDLISTTLKLFLL